MKVCYLIQTHKNPEQIYRLVKILKESSPNSQVVVSHDVSKYSLNVAELQEIPGVEVFLTQGERGSFSIVQGYLDVVDWLFRENIDFDWLINISGQDYPIQPIPGIETFLAETEYDGFIEHFNVLSSESHWSVREGYSRYFFRYHKLSHLAEWQKELLRTLKAINYIQPLFRINVARGLRIGLQAATPFSDKFMCYGGSFFCTLSRKCVRYIYEFVKYKPELIDYYGGVSPSDESFLQTVLVNSRLFNLCNDNKRYFDFSQTRNGHPRILRTKDYPAVIESNAHFARKFDIAQDSQILDLIDARILGRSQEERLAAKAF